jgi:hypothetical protein
VSGRAGKSFAPKTCLRKRRYTLKVEAEAAMKRLGERQLRMYFCYFCVGYHLGRRKAGL